MCTVFLKGWCSKWNSLLALLIFRFRVVVCCNKCVVFPVWVVAPFCHDPEASVEYGSMEHGQLIVTTFTQLFLMCAFAVLVQKPGIVWDEKCKLEEKLVSEFLNVTMYLIHLHSSYLIKYPSFSESSISAPLKDTVAVCHLFPSYPHCPCPLVALSWTNVFSLPCLYLGKDTQFAAVDQFSSQNSILALPS